MGKGPFKMKGPAFFKKKSPAKIKFGDLFGGNPVENLLDPAGLFGGGGFGFLGQKTSDLLYPNRGKGGYRGEKILSREETIARDQKIRSKKFRPSRYDVVTKEYRGKKRT
tara:strand:+ start:79 stop:408 length:330 start_codon:yes stop_codon:yes gene_type:complete